MNGGRRSSCVRALLGALLIAAPACRHAASAPSSTPTAAAPAPAVQPVGPGTAGQPSEPYGLFLSTVGCWLGGMWAEAEGVDVRADREVQSEAHCRDVLAKVYGDKGVADEARLRQLRAIDEGTAADIVDKLGSLLPEEHEQKHLRALLSAVAVALRDNLHARRAADKVRRDVEEDRTPRKLTDDEQAAATPLSAHGGMEALLALDAGSYSADAHALGVLAAMERFEVARTLPRHLKLFAVRDAARLLFGAKAPDVGIDPTRPVQPGSWLSYLVDLSIAAGHQPPASAQSPRTRHDLAWAGVLAGIADKLEPDVAGASAPLAPTLKNVVVHLRAEQQKVLHPRAGAPAH